jgi:hypothetical protein
MLAREELPNNAGNTPQVTKPQQKLNQYIEQH